MSEPESPLNIALIIGCPRSGTSIVGEFVAAHEAVVYAFEAHGVWERVPGQKGGSHRMTAEHATEPIVTLFRQAFAGILQARPDKKIFVEKCPRNSLRIPLVREIFPEVKLIHVVRDGRDVTCSLQPGIEKGWRHARPPNWRELAEEPLVIRCAKAWRDIVTIALDDLVGVPHLQLKYEDLLESPLDKGREIRDYLGLSPSQSMDAFASKIQNPTRDSYHAKLQSNWYRDDHRTRIGRWKENLTSEEQETVHEILEPTLKRLGYV